MNCQISAPLKPIVNNAQLRRDKRRRALLTLLFPILGSAMVIPSAALTGISWPEVALFFGMFCWVTLGLEVGFHRLVAHRAFRTPKFMHAFWWISALMAAQCRGIYWVANHRRHHAHSDTPDDPHSPYWRMGESQAEQLSGLRGLWHAQQGNTYTGHATNVSVYAADIVGNSLYNRLDRLYPLWVALGLILPAAAGGLIYGTWLGAWSCFLWGGPLRIFIQHQAYFTNGSLAHRFGEKLFMTGDSSYNNWYCALWTFGSALQNTHHAFPQSAYLRQRWYDIDIAGGVIRAMALVGLATDVRFPSHTELDAKRLVPRA